LQTRAGMVTQPDLSHRKRLYRVLDEQDLIVAHGGQRVWNLYVTGPGNDDRVTSPP